MKKHISQIGIIAFFTAVIVVSAVFMFRDDEAAIETVNTVSEASAEQTSEATDTEQVTYPRDIDPEAAAMPTFTVETAAPVTEPSETVSETTVHVTETETSKTTRAIITSRQRKEYDSNAVYLDMENILQNPELPVGCEITALTILLRHYGFDADKVDMANNYLPKSWGNPQTIDGKLHKDSFYDYFIGDPFSRGYGCFSPAIEKAANAYLADNGGGYTVKNISGCHPDTLYEYLIAGTPVLCWATDGMIEPEYHETWYDNATGKQLDWYLNEHCFVLAGFNIKNSTVTLNDPMKGIIDYNIDKFEVRFKQMHSQAIVLIPNGSEPVATETQVPFTEETTLEEQTETVAETTQATVTETSIPTETFSESLNSTLSDVTYETAVSTEYIDTDFFTGEFIS